MSAVLLAKRFQCGSCSQTKGLMEWEMRRHLEEEHLVRMDGGPSSSRIKVSTDLENNRRLEVWEMEFPGRVQVFETRIYAL